MTCVALPFFRVMENKFEKIRVDGSWGGRERHILSIY